MATAGFIVDRCFRENNLVAINQVVSASKRAEALNYLSEIVSEALGGSAGELLSDWPVPSRATNFARPPLLAQSNVQSLSYYQGPPQNARLIVNLTQATTLYFHLQPSDGARMSVINTGNGFDVFNLTLSGNGRLIEGASSLVLSSALVRSKQWFYRAELADWREIVLPLVEATELPFHDRFTNLWIAMLAIRLSPLYGKEPNTVTLGVATKGMTEFKAQYAQYMPAANFPDALWFNSAQSWGGYGWSSDDLLR